MEVGDYAVATEIARQYAFAAQARLGDLDNTLAATSRPTASPASTPAAGSPATGATASSCPSRPGDLDEAVIAFLHNSDASQDVDDGDSSVGTAFQRFDAYRAGFLEGPDACDAFLDDG